MTRLKTLQRLALGAAVLAPLCASTVARASDITFAVIGPHEYELPVNFQPFNVFVQYGEYNSQSQAYNGNGHLGSIASSNLYVGLSKYVRFWTFDGIPNVGFAYEIIVPEVRIDQRGGGVGGIGDPLTGPALWFKPNAQSTFGFQTFMQVPIGASDVSNHYWANYSSFLFDYQFERVSFTGDAGVVFRSQYNMAGNPSVNEGTTGHVNLRWGYKNTSMFEPFVGFDWQSTSASHFAQTRLVAAPYSQEAALGAGVMATISKSTSLTLRYSHDVEGVNAVATNAAYLKFVAIW